MVGDSIDLVKFTRTDTEVDEMGALLNGEGRKKDEKEVN
jgi:hypothetical protein